MCALGCLGVEDKSSLNQAWPKAWQGYASLALQNYCRYVKQTVTDSKVRSDYEQDAARLDSDPFSVHSDHSGIFCSGAGSREVEVNYS